MGKDNVPFHSVIFPGSTIGAGGTWTKVNHLSATEYLNYEGSKFSKSRGIGVFGNNARDTGIDPDIWRFYLLSRRPESGSDTEFQWEEFVSVNNNELLKNLGNLVLRVIKFCHAKMGGVVPQYTVLEEHRANVDALLQAYIANLEAMKLRPGLANVLQISALGNKFLQDNKLDNRLFTEEPERCGTVIGMALNQIHLIASLLSPYMPKIAESIFDQLGVEPLAKIPDSWDPASLPSGHTLGEPKALFTLIPASKIEEWREAYGGEELRAQKLLAAEKAAAKKEAKRKEKEAKIRLKMEALAVKEG
jgi:methionyl-tRNA synthetase